MSIVVGRDCAYIPPTGPPTAEPKLGDPSFVTRVDLNAISRMLSTPRTHAWMFCLATLPPLASTYLLSNSHYDLSALDIAVHLLILGIWIFSLNSIVYEHYFGPFSDVPMGLGDWFALGHTPYMFENVQGLPCLKFMKGLKLDHRGIFRLKTIFHLRGQLVLTAPETFNEVLNSHCYDCKD